MTKWTLEDDGWERCSTCYRLLVSDTGKPRFAGAARRYAEIHVLADGVALLKSASGYVRAYPTLEAAKAGVKQNGSI